VAAVHHVDGVSSQDEGGVADLEDPLWIGEVHPRAVPHLGGGSHDLLFAARLRQSAAGNEHGSGLEQLRQRLVVAEHERVLEQHLELLWRPRPRDHVCAS